jgi:Holliday junction resolvasome RuvABC endonuclease subunit
VSLDGYLLAIDPGATPGFAILRADGSLVQSGFWRVKPRAHQGSGARFTNLIDQLDGLSRTWPAIASLAYELPGLLKIRAPGQPVRDASPETHLSLFGCVATLAAWAERREMHYAGFSPQQAKKAATGSGNASKVDVASAVAERFSLELLTINPNEADALAIGLAGLAELECISLPVVERDDKHAKKTRARKTNGEHLLDHFYGDTHA